MVLTPKNSLPAVVPNGSWARCRAADTQLALDAIGVTMRGKRKLPPKLFKSNDGPRFRSISPVSSDERVSDEVAQVTGPSDGMVTRRSNARRRLVSKRWSPSS